MGARLISIVKKQLFSFDFQSSNANGIGLGGVYDIRDACSGTLLVRVSNAPVPTFPGGLGSFSLQMANLLQLPDEPGVIYIPAGGGAIVTINIASTDSFTTPALYTASWTTASSPASAVQVGVAFSSVYAGGAGQGTITLAVDLLVRDTS
jgi:hypothetical protein